jgi:DNA-binding MarR family transcriptional regulator
MTDGELLARWQIITQGVARTQHRVAAQIDQSGLPAQWFAALHLLLQAPETRLPMSRLARDLTMTSGGFTKLADRMAREGLIDRRGSSDDRRVVYATLTEQGVEIARRLTVDYIAALREHVAGVISETSLVAVAEVARTLSDAHATAADEEDSAADAARSAADAVRDPAQPDRRGRGRATS